MSDENINALQPGYLLDRYRIKRVLGTGGFGCTYLAVETALDRPVAIKEYVPKGIAQRSKPDLVIGPISASERPTFEWGLTRFRDEARTLVQFRHPNIVTVLSYFDALGTAYLVMDYIDGDSLAAIINRAGTLAQGEIEDFLFPLLDGLKAVHGAGFLHRDIKPDNIFIRRDGQPVLLDFGAAREALGQATRTLTAIVSHGYAPYEQYGDDGGDQGPWTDIYALGATVYAAMTGARPVSAPDRVNALVGRKPDPMVAASDIDADGFTLGFLAAIDAALAIRESERPQDVDAFERLLRPRPHEKFVTPTGAGSAETLHSPLQTTVGQSRRQLWDLCAGSEKVGPDLRISACTALINSGSETSDDLSAAFKYRGDAYLDERQYNLAIQDYNEAIRLDPQMAAALINRGLAYFEKGDCDRAIRDYDQLIRLRPQDAYAFFLRGAAYAKKRLHDRAIEDYDEAIRLRPQFANAFASRGNAYLEKGQHDPALQDFDQAVRINPRDADAFVDRGNVHSIKGQYARAIQDFDQAIRLNPQKAAAYYSRGLVAHLRLGEYDRAIEDYSQAIQLDPQADKFCDRGRAYSDRGEHARAIRDFDEAIRLRPQDGFLFYTRGVAYTRKGDYDRAIQDFDEAIRLGPFALAFKKRGDAYRLKGDKARAEADIAAGEALEEQARYKFVGSLRGRSSG